MIQTQLVQIAYNGLFLVLMLSAPPILVSMFLGILVAVFQAATQIQEQTLSFTIKLAAVIFTLMLTGGWLGGEIASFAAHVIHNFPRWTLAVR